MAKIHLCHTWDAIQNLSFSTENGAERASSSSSKDEADEIEQLLMAKEREINTVVQKSKVPIASLLDAYSIIITRTSSITGHPWL